MTSDKNPPPSELNQIRDALVRAEKTVTLRPERGQRTYRNIASLTEGTLCHVEEGGRRLTMDVGKALGGNDDGPNPSMVLRSAVSGCVAIGIKQWAARHGIMIERIEVALETSIDARGQLGVCDEKTPGFEKSTLNILVVSTASKNEIERAIDLSIRYSPVLDAFVNPQPYELQLTVQSGDPT